MRQGNFYFIKNEYFDKFTNCKLMLNKEKINGEEHNRPSYYCFEDKAMNIKWFVPISSKVAKYKEIYNNKIKKNGECDTIVFGYVLGEERAFLIQNICPVTEKYINNIYINTTNSVPVQIKKSTMSELNNKIRRVLNLYKNKGIKLFFTNVELIENELVNELKKDSFDNLYIAIEKNRINIKFGEKVNFESIISYNNGSLSISDIDYSLVGEQEVVATVKDKFNQTKQILIVLIIYITNDGQATEKEAAISGSEADVEHITDKEDVVTEAESNEGQAAEKKEEQ